MTGDKLENILLGYAKEYLPIGGRVYVRGMRPIQKKAADYQEDCIVAFLTGAGTDLQRGTCIMNVYVTDIQTKSGLFYKDKRRCEEIADVLDGFPSWANKQDGEVHFKQSDMTYTFPVEDIRQHFVSLKMDFRVLNDKY